MDGFGQGRRTAVLVLSGGTAGVLAWALWDRIPAMLQWAEGHLAAAGPWAPALFVGVYVGMMCLLVPSAPLTVLGGVLFGPYYGFLLVWVGEVLGASGAFAIARTLGRGFALRHGGERFRQFDGFVAGHGLFAVFLLRLANLPLTPASFGLGLTGVCFRDYCLGTALGVVPGTLAVTSVAGIAGDELARRGAPPLALSLPLAGLAVGVFVVSLRYARVRLRRREAKERRPSGGPEQP